MIHRNLHPLNFVCSSDENDDKHPSIGRSVADATGVQMADWSSKNPYMSTITENYILNGEGSRKETRHIAFDLGDSGLTYKVGDALGVMAQNPPHIVDELIEVQGWDADEMVITHNGEKSLWDALKCDFEVHMANKKFVASLADKVVSGQLRIKSTVMRRVRNGQEIDEEST